MNAIISAAMNNARTVLAAMVLIFIGGLYTFNTIPKESEPDVPIPFFYVNIHHDGISPRDAERLLVKPMETYLRSIEGLKQLRGIAHEGGAGIIAEFDAGFDQDKALLDVREEVDKAKSELPDDTDEPIVQEFNISLFPIITVVLYGEAPERAMIRLARDLQDALEALPGVLEAPISGDREELLEVTIDPVLLESYGISQDELLNVVLKNNRLVAAGSLDTGQGRFSVKVPGLFETAQDVLELPIKVSGDSVVTLGDITQIRRTYKDPDSFARLNGQPALTLGVSKRVGQNAIESIQQVRDVIASKQKNWPEGVNVDFLQDKSIQINDMLTGLQNNIISAILLVSVVIIAAMGLRAGGLVGMSVPGSFLLAILLLGSFGYTINQVVMFALILSVGILVDGAIVVSEYADRKMVEGLPPKDAYKLAAQRMSWPIISSTATTLAAFLPLLFWPGMAGGFMKFLPLTLIFTLTASLLMALVFLPTLGGLIGKSPNQTSSSLGHLAATENAEPTSLPGLTGVYARLLTRLVHRPFRFIFSTLGVLFVVIIIYVISGPQIVFFPETEPESATLQVHARGNLSIFEQDDLVRSVEKAIEGIEGIKSVFTNTGGQGAFGREQAEDVVGTVGLVFNNWRDRPPVREIVAKVRARTANLPGIIVEPVLNEDGPSAGKDVQIEISSDFPQLITPAIVRLREHMESMAGLIDVEDSRPLPGIEWEIQVDRAEAGRYGTDIASVGNIVQLVTNGIKVGEYRPDDADEEVDIRVRFPEAYRNINQLDQLRVQTPGGLVPLSNFVKREPQPKVGNIERVNGKRAMTVKANSEKGYNTNAQVIEITDWIESENFDPRLTIQFRGEDEDQKESAAFLEKAFLVAMFLMAVILLTQFNSFYHAALILTAVILSTVGVVVGLEVTGRTFIIVMTGVGIISLAGIVVNNNIVLIDTYARLVKSGVPVLEAIVRTGAQRLRPVLLTSITTVVGLLPMVFQVEIDFLSRDVAFGAPSSLWWVDLALAVSIGLTFATVLTLILTPCLLAARYHFKKRKDPEQASVKHSPSPAE